MKQALIVWGGWAGHEPEACAKVVAKMLEEDGFTVVSENTTEAFADWLLRWHCRCFCDCVPAGQVQAGHWTGTLVIAGHFPLIKKTI